MAEAKTRPTAESVQSFLKTIPDPARRHDAEAIVRLMASATGQPAVMWGPAIIGFGSYHYVYESGREGDAPIVAFSPRKQNFALYLTGLLQEDPSLLEALGEYTTGKGCLYLKRVTDVDESILKSLVTRTFEMTRRKYPGTVPRKRKKGP